MPILSRLSSKLAALDFAIGSYDFVIIIFFVVVSLAYVFFFVSRGKLLPLLVSSYMSYVLVELAPFLDLDFGKRFGLTQLFEVKLAAFAIIFLVVFFVLSRVIFQSPVGAETFGIIPSLVLAIVQTGFTLAILVSFLPQEVTKQFSDFLSRVFVGNNQLFYWAAVNVVLLLVLGRKANQAMR